VICEEGYVTRDNPLTPMLDDAHAPQDFDLCSIDIDGMDYWMWKDLITYRPRLVVIEVNCSVPPNVTVVPKYDPRGKFAASTRAMVELGKQKGYELAAFLLGNCFFVVEEEFPKLGLKDNSIESLFNSPFVPVVICDQVGNHYVIHPSIYGGRKTVQFGVPESLERCELHLTEEQVLAQSLVARWG
jgi:hypothetical protein